MSELLGALEREIAAIHFALQESKEKLLNKNTKHANQLWREARSSDSNRC